MTRCTLSFALALAGVGAETKPDDATATCGAEFTFKFRQKDDGVRVSHTRDGVVFRITSPGGISNVEVALKEGEWPRQITLQLELGMLESFVAGNGKLDLSGSLRAAGEKGTLWFNGRGERVEDQAQAVHTMKMKATADQQKRLIEVTLPVGFCSKDTKTLAIHWIDAFRR